MCKGDFFFLLSHNGLFLQCSKPSKIFSLPSRALHTLFLQPSLYLKILNHITALKLIITFLGRTFLIYLNRAFLYTPIIPLFTSFC